MVQKRAEWRTTRIISVSEAREALPRSPADQKQRSPFWPLRRVKHFLDSRNGERLKALLNPAENRAGRRHVVAKDEDTLVKQLIRYAARRGFALTFTAVRKAFVFGTIRRGGASSLRTCAGEEGRGGKPLCFRRP